MDCEGNILTSDEKKSRFIRNGAKLQKELLSFTNGRYNVPLCNFSAEEIVKATNGFDERQNRLQIGNVAYKTYRGFLRSRDVFIKAYKCYDYGDARSMAIRDVAITSQMSHHKNVLKIVGCCLEFDYPAVVYEYSGTDLLSQKTVLPWKSRVNIACDVASVILYLHTTFPTPVVHKNITPSKVILDQNGVAKLFDFSLSTRLPPGESRVEDDNVEGNLWFIDPEYMITKVVTQKNDVDGFGVFLHVLLTGNEPTFSVSRKGQWLSTLDHLRENEFEQYVDSQILHGEGGSNREQLHALVQIASRCIKTRGEERPDMIDIARELQRIKKAIFHH